MTRILDRIDRPQDLHDLTEEELEQVAQEVRGRGAEALALVVDVADVPLATRPT